MELDIADDWTAEEALAECEMCCVGVSCAKSTLSIDTADTSVEHSIDAISIVPMEMEILELRKVFNSNTDTGSLHATNVNGILLPRC